MPWACSEAVSRRQAAGVVAAASLALAAAGGTLSPAARGSSGSVWRLGVFPVVNFAGYTSHFGTRTGPWGGVEPHYGLDIAAPMGSPIRNWWGGVVQSVINDGTCGLGLVIRSGDYEHIYCHLSGSVQGGVYRSGAVRVRQGQALPMGALIGHVGVTGRSTGPHLHWGMRFRGAWIDPALVLREMARARRTAALAPTAPPAPRVALSR
jgi:murein DD-endopeptidase MepM/ murein hydrolase activator NlpD